MKPHDAREGNAAVEHGAPVTTSQSEPGGGLANTREGQMELQDAAYHFVETLVPRSDGHGGPWPGEFPLWHGWALREAFVAGAQWQKNQKI